MSARLLSFFGAALGALATACLGDKVSVPESYDACFGGVRLPVLRTERERVPDYCFALPEGEDGVVTYPFAPAECSGVLIPERSGSTACVDYDPYSTLVYLPDEYMDEVDFNAQSNIIRLAEDAYWPITKDSYGSYGRSPCGGDATCPDLARELVDCYVSVTDCALGEPPEYESTVIRTYHFLCSGTHACAFEGRAPEECCELVP